MPAHLSLPRCSHNTPIVQRHIAYLKLLELQGDLLSNILFSDR